MPPPRPLRPGEAARTLANRLGVRLAPRLWQLKTRFGIAPYRVFLLWSKWSGTERGEGKEQLVHREELLPTPIVEYGGIQFDGSNIGRLQTGFVTLKEVVVTYTADVLQGLKLPENHENVLPEPWDFCYEIVEDDRGDPNPKRAKFRLAKVPFRDAGNVQWVISLERMTEDNQRDGSSDYR